MVKNFNFVAYNVQRLDQTYIANAAKYVSYMYITNDNLPNPWDTLPPYLGQLVAILDAANSATTQSPTGVLLPLYIYPQVWISGNAYQQLANIAKTHPSVEITAIINPNSGPDSTQNSDYITGISILKNAGVRVIGYVYTSYAARPITAVETDIQRYISFYPNLDGILFDEMSNTAGMENYYLTLTNYAKSKGLTFIAGNPGTDTLPSYIGTVDTMTIYEGSGLPSLSYLSGGWHSNYDKRNFSIAPLDIYQLNETYIKNAANHIGYMYMTNNTLPNPWQTLPPYFEKLVAIIDEHNKQNAATTITTTTPTLLQPSPPANTNTTLGNPILNENDKVTGQRVLDVSNGMPKIEISFIGNGTIKGINYTDIGTGMITSRPDGSVYIQGQAAVTAINGETTTTTFQSIGRYGADGKLMDNGTIFFNTALPPNGKLASLNDEVVIFKDITDTAKGNGVVKGWEWK